MLNWYHPTSGSVGGGASTAFKNPSKLACFNSQLAVRHDLRLSATPSLPSSRLSSASNSSSRHYHYRSAAGGASRGLRGLRGSRAFWASGPRGLARMWGRR